MDYFFKQKYRSKSVFEEKLEIQNNLINEFKTSKIAKDISNAFPDARLDDLKKEE